MLSPGSSGLFPLLSLPPLHRNRLSLAYFNKRKVLTLCPPPRHSVSHLLCIVSLLESTVSKWLLFLISYSFLVTQWGWLPVKSVCQDQEGPSYKYSKLHMGQTAPVLWSTAFPVASTMPSSWWVLSKSLLNVLRHSVLFDLNNMRIIELLSSFHSHDALMLDFAWPSWTIHSPPLPLLIPSILVFRFYP